MNVQRNPIIAAVVGLGCSVASGCEVGADLPPVEQHERALSGAEREFLTYRWRGQALFLSRLDWLWSPIRTALEEAAQNGDDVARAIEEADIYRLDEARQLLFVLNAYRGLQIIDVSAPETPRLVGEDRLGGYPVEMFLRGGYAFVLLNDPDDARTLGDEFQGAVLRVYDVSDPRSPQAKAEFPIAGNIRGSHLLTAASPGGSAIIYVVSSAYLYEEPGPEDEYGVWAPVTYVQSIDVTDPESPRAVERVSFAGEGIASHVTPEAVFLASHEWSTDTTRVQYVDIADLGGDVRVRGAIELAGRLQWGERGDLQLDFDATADVLRVASEVQATDAGEPPLIRISTVDVSNPDAPGILDQLDIGRGHRLLAARFAGERAYVFHAIQVDPLEVIDLSDPTALASLGILQIPGWVDHIEVRGDYLIALGVAGDEGQRIALILFDVSDPDALVELARVPIGETWSWTDAIWDLRSFRIIDELGLIALPVTSYSREEDRVRTWLQLASFELGGERPTLTERGRVATADRVRRTLPIGERLIAFGELGLQVISVADPDEPVVIGALELARDVADFVVAGGYGIASVASAYESDLGAELRVVALPRADERLPIGRVPLDINRAQLAVVGPTLVAAIGQTPAGEGTLIQVVSIASPERPRIAGELRIATLDWATIAATQAALVLAGPDYDAGTTALYTVDLTEPSTPRLRASLDLGRLQLETLRAHGARVYLSGYVPVVDEEPPIVVTDAPADRPWPTPSAIVSYRLYTIALRHPAAPRIRGPISVPGPYVTSHEVGPVTILFTSDRFRAARGELARGVDSLLLVDHVGVAILLDLIEIPEEAGPVLADDSTALYAVSTWGDTGTRTALHSIDLSRPDELVRADVLELPDLGFAYLGAVVGECAFVRGGWSDVAVIDTSDAYALRQVTTAWAPGWYEAAIAVGRAVAFLPAGLFGTHAVPACP